MKYIPSAPIWVFMYNLFTCHPRCRSTGKPCRYS